jgi:hypothetical protein
MEFPDWVTGPTPCKTRTFSVSLAVDPLDVRVKNRYPTKLVKALDNSSPVVVVRNLENGKLYPHYVTASLDLTRFELVED